MYENKKFEGVHYSRIVASWLRIGEDPFTYKFGKWLDHLDINGKKMDEFTVNEILQFARTGKHELEMDALKFIGKEDWARVHNEVLEIQKNYND